MSKHTYMRDAVPHTHNGTCPCCLKQHRATKRGVVTRHGWKETGRQVGSWGQGFQWGECAGWDKRPLEMTDADALVLLDNLESQIRAAEKEARLHEGRGRDSYHQEFQIRLYRHGPDAEAHAKALRDAGMEFEQSAIQVKQKGIRVFYEPRERFLVTIPRGSQDLLIKKSQLTGKSWDRSTVFAIKSWETLRQEHAQGMRRAIKGLQEAREHILAAVEHHRGNPSNGTPVAVKGSVVHFVGERTRKYRDRATGEIHEKVVSYIACGTKALTRRESSSKGEVTCKRCLAKLAKD